MSLLRNQSDRSGASVRSYRLRCVPKQCSGRPNEQAGWRPPGLPAGAGDGYDGQQEPFTPTGSGRRRSRTVWVSVQGARAKCWQRKLRARCCMHVASATRWELLTACCVELHAAYSRWSQRAASIPSDVQATTSGGRSLLHAAAVGVIPPSGVAHMDVPANTRRGDAVYPYGRGHASGWFREHGTGSARDARR